MMLTHTRLRELFSYDPDSGLFTRKVRRARFPAGSIAGSPDVKGYIIIEIDGRAYKAHRLAVFYVTGRMPSPREIVDHIDLDKANNRIGNLRVASSAENCANRSAHASNALGVKGVHRLPSGNFRAKFRGRGLGVFTTIEAASAAYERAAKAAVGEFARVG